MTTFVRMLDEAIKAGKPIPVYVPESFDQASMTAGVISLIVGILVGSPNTALARRIKDLVSLGQYSAGLDINHVSNIRMAIDSALLTPKSTLSNDLITSLNGVMAQIDTQFSNVTVDQAKAVADIALGLDVGYFAKGTRVLQNNWKTFLAGATVAGLGALAYVNREGIRKVTNNAYDYLFEDNNLQVAKPKDPRLINAIIVDQVYQLKDKPDVYKQLPGITGKYSADNILTIDMIMASPESRAVYDTLMTNIKAEEYAGFSRE